MANDANDARPREAPEVTAHREHVLQQVTARLSAAATREEILNAFLDEGSHALDSSAAVAYLKDAGGKALTLVAHRGVSEALARRSATLALDASYPVARSVRDGQPVWVSDCDTIERDFPEFWRNAQGAFARQSLVALPLRVGGDVVGGLGFAFAEKHPFDGRERELVTTLAARVEAAMDRARQFEESQRARADAEALLRFNEVVSGILAHDLRNPLAAILMNARMLRSAEEERSRTIGGRIITSGERMARMIDQILEWTRLRVASGRLELRRGRCDLATVAEAVVSELRLRKADVPIALSADGDLIGQWDGDRLAQVVSNLVGNALEHATRPGVSVVLSADGPLVRLAVENEGRIDDELLPRVFEPFRGRAAGVASGGRGLGLGLYITRQIVVAHGGRVELEREGARVTFIVTLPRAETL